MTNRPLLARGLMAVVVLALVAPSSVAQSRARCDSPVVVLSYHRVAGEGGALNSNAFWCAVDEAEGKDDLPYDGRLLNPGTDAISIRFIAEIPGAPPAIKAKITGLGFEGKRLTLVHGPVTGGVAYDSGAPLALKDGAAASGCLDVKVWHTVKVRKQRRDGTVSVRRVKVVNEKSAWHTLGVTC